ncbi:carboxylate--amine ligase [Bacilliculturomica massiliensis]|uniref:carboxylate--amine ligase n=1 Tax=Bacilliculturomica massiliensis TaxID=1917867 RepID=UPI00103095AE|nr:ATP-grasp domain-containing protein [Bacilliculturomica massiliensis]
MEEIRFIPLLFAGDINVYSVARAFHEAYGIKSFAYGKYPTGPCWQSAILNYQANEKADEQETFLKLVEDFAAAHHGEKVLLLGCGDSYVQLISENRERFAENVTAPYIGADMMNDLIHKEKFYAMCEKAGVDYPDTFVHHPEDPREFELPFDGPFIVKPSNGIEYWRHPYATQKKVYKADTRAEVDRILEDIYGSGYRDSVIIQNFIPGDDTYMRVLTSYSDKEGRVKLMCLGHVLLEEHTPHGIGNHAVIVTEYDEDLCMRFKKLLEDMNYVGFSNFDIKYDERDGKYKVFEINTRQGRSNFYVTAAGANIAQYVVEDWIYDHPIDFRIVKEESLWQVVPRGVAFRYVRPEKYRAKMRELSRAGKAVNPLFYKADGGFSRWLKLQKNQLGHYVKFRKYLGK